MANATDTGQERCDHRLVTDASLRRADAPPGLRTDPPVDAESHLPVIVREWLVRDVQTRHRRLDATLVFADVSGFTALTERLAERGKIGAEDLTDLLGGVMGDLIGLAIGRGGDLLKYGGDALLLLFRGPGHERRAVDAALAMRADVGRIRPTRAGRVSLGMSIGIATGAVDLLLLGHRHRELLVAGPASAAAVQLEHEAGAGDIHVSAATMRALTGTGWEEGVSAVPDGFRLDDAAHAANEPDPTPLPALGLDPEIALTAIPDGVRDALGSATAGEHRQVTVGFVHAALPAMDEDGIAVLASLVSTVQDACADASVTCLSTDVDAGAVKFILTAGAPRASDVDVDRMLEATRHIVTAAEGVSIRAGVNRGRVFVVELGTDERRVYTVLGDAVNLAARVMGRAGTGEVVVTHETLIDSRIAHEETVLEPFLVKGKSEPIEASMIGAAIGIRTGGFTADLVGRSRELGALRSAIETAQRSLPAQVDIVGPAGSGKTALVEAALARYVTEDLFVLHIRPGAIASGSPYFATRAALRLAIDVDEHASDDEVIAALTALLPDDQVDWLPLVAPPFGVTVPDTRATASIEARFRRPRAHALVADVLRDRLPERAVMVVEDLHWLDTASLRLLENLLGAFADLPWALVTTSREDDARLLADRPGTVERLHIDGLDDDAALAFVIGEGDDRLPQATATALVERAGGNPLFLRELRDAVRSGAELDDLPDRVERLAATRIDALEADDRELLRAASVLGQRFDVRLLASLVEQPDLDAPTVVHRLRAFVSGEEGSWLRFTSTLVRDAAYEALSFRDRRRLHSRAAELVRRVSSDEAPVVELLSHHCFHAELWEDAWTWSVAAGERAAAAEAALESMRFFQRAMEAERRIDARPRELVSVLRRLALAAELCSHLEVSDRALARASRLIDDPVELASIYERRGRVRDLEARYDTALRWYRRGLRLLDEVDDRGGRVAADLRLGMAQTLMRLRRLRRSADVLREVVRSQAAEDHPEVMARACTLLDSVLTDLGDPEAVSWRDRAFPIYAALGDLVGQARALGNRGVDAYYDGDWDHALELYERAADLASRAGDVKNQIVLQSNISEILSDRGDAEAAHELLLDVLATSRAARYEAGIALALGNLGRACTRLGRSDDAHRHLAEAQARWGDIGDEAMVTEIALRVAEQHLDDSDIDAAEAELETVRTGSDVFQDLPWLRPAAVRIGALIAAGRGAVDDAVEQLRRAVDDPGASSLDRVLALSSLEAVVTDRATAAAVASERDDLARQLGVRVRPPAVATG